MCNKEKKKTETVLGEGISWLGLLMRIWEFDDLKGNCKAPSSDANSSQRPVLAPEAAKNPQPNVNAFLLWYINFAIAVDYLLTYSYLYWAPEVSEDRLHSTHQSLTHRRDSEEWNKVQE